MWCSYFVSDFLLDQINRNALLESYLLIKPASVKVLCEFYRELFDESPQLYHQLKDIEPKERIKRLQGFLLKVIESSKDDFSDMSYFNRLGFKLAIFGVSADQLDAFGFCLLKVMKRYVSEYWSQEYSDAWYGAFEKVIREMNKGIIAYGSCTVSSKLIV